MPLAKTPQIFARPVHVRLVAAADGDGAGHAARLELSKRVRAGLYRVIDQLVAIRGAIDSDAVDRWVLPAQRGRYPPCRGFGASLGGRMSTSHARSPLPSG